MLYKHVLVLVSLHPDMKDAVGNEYPTSGYISHDSFVKDKAISSGYFGVLWGRSATNQFGVNEAENEVCVIAKIELNSDAIMLDGEYGVKFKSGIIVFYGDRESCARFIVNYKEDVRNMVDGEDIVNKKDIMGVVIENTTDTIEIENHQRHAITSGYASRSITHGVSSHAIATGLEGSATTTNDFANAIVTGNDGMAVASGVHSKSIATGLNSRCRTSGDLGKSIAAGYGSISISDGKKGMAICLDGDGQAAAGEDGVLILAYHDQKDKKRISIGYVGEGIKPNVIYRCNDNGEFEEVI